MASPPPMTHGLVEGVNVNILWQMMKYMFEMLKTTVDQQKVDRRRSLRVTPVSHLFHQ